MSLLGDQETRFDELAHKFTVFMHVCEFVVYMDDSVCSCMYTYMFMYVCMDDSV